MPFAQGRDACIPADAATPKTLSGKCGAVPAAGDGEDRRQVKPVPGLAFCGERPREALVPSTLLCTTRTLASVTTKEAWRSRD